MHTEHSPPVKLLNTTSINNNKVGYILLPNILSKTAKKAHIISELKSEVLELHYLRMMKANSPVAKLSLCLALVAMRRFVAFLFFWSSGHL